MGNRACQILRGFSPSRKACGGVSLETLPLRSRSRSLESLNARPQLPPATRRGGFTQAVPGPVRGGRGRGRLRPRATSRWPGARGTFRVCGSDLPAVTRLTRGPVRVDRREQPGPQQGGLHAHGQKLPLVPLEELGEILGGRRSLRRGYPGCHPVAPRLEKIRVPSPFSRIETSGPRPEVPRKVSHPKFKRAPSLPHRPAKAYKNTANRRDRCRCSSAW